VRILFDNSTPRGLARALTPRHSVTEARQLEWDRLQNGELLAAAERNGYEVLVTPDQNMRYQQNFTGRKIALVVLGNGRWTLVKHHLTEIATAVDAAMPGSYTEVAITDTSRLFRPK